MNSLVLLLAGGAIAGGCSFSGGGSGNDSPDAGLAPDAAPCDSLQLRLTVNGEDLGLTADQTSFSHDLRVSDLLVIETLGSCGRQGDPALTWTFPTTFEGELGLEDPRRVAVFPRIAGSEQIVLVASDSVETATVTFDVTTIGFVDLPYVSATGGNDDNVRALALKGSQLWIAVQQNGGILLANADDPHDAPMQQYPTALEPGTVVEPRKLFLSGDLLWVLDTSGNDRVHRVDTAEVDLAGTLQTIDSPAGNSIDDIGYHPDGLRVAASDDLWIYNDGLQMFDATAEILGEVQAFAATETQLWYGKDTVHRFDDLDLTFPASGNDGVESFLLTGDEVWVGGRGIGVFNEALERIDRQSNADDVISMAVDSSGDIWAASGAGGGVLRYHRALGTWHTITSDDTGTGLRNKNVRAVVIHPTASGDLVYVGTDSGLHVLGLGLPDPARSK